MRKSPVVATLSMCGVLLAGTALVPPAIASARRAPAPQTQALITGVAPVVKQMPAKITLESGRPMRIVMQGQNFEEGLSVRVENLASIHTFCRASLIVTPTTVEFEVVDLEPGNYTVVVSNPGGAASKPLTLAVKMK